jgi:hypothetical protein
MFLFIIINGVFHRQHDFIININLSYYYGNMFRLNVVIFRMLTSPKPKNIFTEDLYYMFFKIL